MHVHNTTFSMIMPSSGLYSPSVQNEQLVPQKHRMHCAEDNSKCLNMYRTTQSRSYLIFYILNTF
jgi:hypothetical protein